MKASDVPPRFGPPKCSCCKNYVESAYDHKMGCPEHPETEYCSVCHPPPAMFYDCIDGIPTFCDEHDEDDLRDMQERHRERAGETLDDIIDRRRDF